MLKIGLTGGIGAGKTTVADLFSELGVPIYNSDAKAKELMVANTELKKKLIQSFGNETFNGVQLNRRYLSELVFNSKDLLNKLNALVHPYVAEDFNLWLSNQNAKYIIKEAAILIENGAYQNMDKIILVTCPLEDRINRVISRDNVSREDVLKKINNQLIESEKLKYADSVIENNDSLAVLKEKVKSIDQEIINYC